MTKEYKEMTMYEEVMKALETMADYVEDYHAVLPEHTAKEKERCKALWSDIQEVRELLKQLQGC